MDALPLNQAAVFLPLAEIEVPARLRPVDEAYVAVLATSIDDHGLEQPIVVRPVAGGDDVTPYRLVAGAHRLAAVRSLGRAEIPAVVRDLDDDEARIVEIDENLIRRELNILDRALFLRERKDVYERLNPEARHGGDRRSDKTKSQPLRLDLGLRAERFTAEVAEKVGLSERTVQLAIQMATELDPEAVDLLRATKFAANQNALLKLSKEPPAKQRTLARALADGAAKTLAAAKVAAGFEVETVDDPQARHLATLLESWARADEGTRAAFLKDIGATLQKGVKR